MEDLLNKLETRIRLMIDQQKDLQKSNNQLNQNKHYLQLEKKQLAEKQQHAINHIETLITRLKSIEQSS